MTNDELIDKIEKRCGCTKKTAKLVFYLVKDHFSKRILIRKKIYCVISQHELTHCKLMRFPLDPLVEEIKTLISSKKRFATELIKFICENIVIKTGQLKYYRVCNGELKRITNSKYPRTIKTKLVLNRGNTDTDDPGPSKSLTCHIIRGK